jgi:hypothetical protein
MKVFISENRNEIFLFVITLFFSISVLFLSSIRFSNDDQFILYRYIENIANGNGFVYNLGEKVLGSTTTLFTLISAALLYVSKMVGLSFGAPSVVAAINIFCLAASAVIFYKILKIHISESFSLLGTAIFSLNLAKIVLEGMETGVFILVTLAFVYGVLMGKKTTSAVFLGLMILTRPDALLIALLTSVFWLISYGWKCSLRLLSISALVILPWIIFATFYFGSFIPQSLVAKTHTADIVNQSSVQALKVQLAHISRLYLGKIIDPQNIKLQVLVNLLPVLILFGIGITNYISRKNWIIFAVPAFYLVALSISNPVMFPWYLSQLEPFWILCTFLGAVYLIDRLPKKYLYIIPVFVLIIGPLFAWANMIESDKETSKKALYDIGQYLKDNAAQNEVVAVNNIGIIGYLSGAKIYDLFGLVNPEAPAFYPVTDECRDKSAQYVIPPNLIRHREPDWLITSGDTEMVDCFKNGKWFASHYKLAEKIGGGKIYKKIK